MVLPGPVEIYFKDFFVFCFCCDHKLSGFQCRHPVLIAKVIQQLVAFHTMQGLLRPCLPVIIDPGMDNTRIPAGLVLALNYSRISLKQENAIILAGQLPSHCTTYGSAAHNGYEDLIFQGTFSLSGGHDKNLVSL